MGSGQADHSSHLTPDRTAQGQAAEEPGDKDRKSAAANPIWQRDLGGYVEAGENCYPGCSCNSASSQRDWCIAGKREQDHRQGCAECTHCDGLVGREFRCQPGQSQGADDRRSTNGCEEIAIQVGATGNLRPRDEWEECPIGAGEQKECSSSNQGCPQMRIVPRVA